ncbi:hypothetical protein AB0N61_17065 [Microbacterium sp. NPDC089320]|uniref:hypothetical protein n=1 Tax=Microbacterium sp. NPDC089320 TaxID=3155182 RepID=UPI003440AA9C
MTLRRTLIAAGAAVVAALVLLGVGLTLPFAVAWGLLTGVVGLLAQLVVPLEPGADAPRIDVTPDRRPTEISRMSWALNTHTGIAGPQITRRVGEILRQRLLRRGVDPHDPEHRGHLERLIGSTVWERLTGPEATMSDIERALDAIDRLDPSAPTGSPPPLPAPTPDRRRPSPFRRSRR